MRAADLSPAVSESRRVPEIRRQVVDMALNGSGIRDTARVLRISRTTMIAIVKKATVL
jgi:transposase-like protein